MTSKRPNLFIVGAPRCGTTRLYGWLAEHPQVFMAPYKEPHYFCFDINAAYERHQGRRVRWLVHDEELYLRLFRHATDEPVLGEASVYYLYSESAPRAIHAFDPNARIVVMLREPVDFLYSLHGRLFSMGDEDRRSFEEALALEDARRQGRAIPRTARYPGLLFYSDYARFSRGILRYQELFPPDQIMCVLLDDLHADPQGTYGRILDFLGVERCEPPADTTRNASTEPRSLALLRLLRWRELRGKGGRLQRFLGRVNTREAVRPPLPDGLRASLMERFAGEVEELSGLLGRDLVGLWGYPKPATEP